jgi:hypothetical protein
MKSYVSNFYVDCTLLTYALGLTDTNNPSITIFKRSRIRLSPDTWLAKENFVCRHEDGDDKEQMHTN